MKLWRYLITGLLAVSLLAFAGCGSQSETSGSSVTSTSSAVSSESSASSASSSATKKKEANVTVTLYYPNAEATRLIADKRTVSLNGQDKYTAAMNALLDGSNGKDQIRIIPEKTKLRGLKVENGTAQVNLSQDVVKDFVGGSTGEEMLVGSIVNTLTEFSEIKRVRILVEGHKIDTLSGHMDLSEPVTRMKDLLH